MPLWAGLFLMALAVRKIFGWAYYHLVSCIGMSVCQFLSARCFASARRLLMSGCVVAVGTDSGCAHL